MDWAGRRERDAERPWTRRCAGVGVSRRHRRREGTRCGFHRGADRETIRRAGCRRHVRARSQGVAEPERERTTTLATSGQVGWRAVAGVTARYVLHYAGHIPEALG